MAVPEQTPYNEFTANGITKIFPLEFDILEKDHLIVLVNDLEPTVGSWSLDLINNSVVFALPPANGANIKITRNTPLERTTDYQSYDNSFRPQPVNSDFDRIWWKLQELGVADWILSKRLDTEIQDRILADIALKEDYIFRDNQLKLDYIQRDNQLKTYINQMISLITGDPEFSGIEAEFVLDGIETQKQINDKTIQKVGSIAELISLNIRGNGQIVQVLSYHPDKNSGGDYFMWSPTLSKSLHDGGYFIDRLIEIPSLATFNTYYSPENAGAGVWVRLNDKQDVHAESYGLVKITDEPTAVWACAAIQQAIKKASVQSTTDYYCKTVKVNKGRYFTTNPIVLSTNGAYSARIPALIGGNGNSIYEVELVKTTINTVGAGFLGGDVDAVIYVSPTTARGGYVYGEHTEGFTLTRNTADVGYGYKAFRSVMGYRGNIQAQGHLYNIYTDDCWMSKVGFLRAYGGKKGIAIRGGTSNFCERLYVDSCGESGFDFYGLTYSNLNCACDGVGGDLLNGGIAYDLSFAKGVDGVFAVERHKGIEFYLHYTECGEIKGRSYHTTPVSDSSYKVFVNGASVVNFSNFTWKDTYANTSVMTPTEISKYTFSNKANYVSSVKFGGIQNDNFASYGLVGQLDSKFAGNVLDAAYSNNCGVVTHILSLNNTAFKRLCFVGKSASIELLSASSMSTSLNRYYANPFVIAEGTLNTIANVKPNRVLKSSISTNSGAPTNLYQLYDSGAAIAAYLQGYIDSEGWLCVRSSNSGNNTDYRFVLVV